VFDALGASQHNPGDCNPLSLPSNTIQTTATPGHNSATSGSSSPSAHHSLVIGDIGWCSRGECAVVRVTPPSPIVAGLSEGLHEPHLRVREGQRVISPSSLSQSQSSRHEACLSRCASGRMSATHSHSHSHSHSTAFRDGWLSQQVIRMCSG
jgi:hypothetical protein